MTQTYKMTLDSCEAKPGIESVLHEIPEDRLEEAIKMAVKAFRKVEVTAEETGEIIYNFYMDADWYTPIFNYGEIIDILCHICYGKR